MLRRSAALLPFRSVPPLGSSGFACITKAMTFRDGRVVGDSEAGPESDG